MGEPFLDKRFQSCPGLRGAADKGIGFCNGSVQLQAGEKGRIENVQPGSGRNRKLGNERGSAFQRNKKSLQVPL